MSAESWAEWKRGPSEGSRGIADAKSGNLLLKRRPRAFPVLPCWAPSLVVRKNIVTLAERSTFGVHWSNSLQYFGSYMRHLLPCQRHFQDLE